MQTTHNGTAYQIPLKIATAGPDAIVHATRQLSLAPEPLSPDVYDRNRSNSIDDGALISPLGPNRQQRRNSIFNKLAGAFQRRRSISTSSGYGSSAESSQNPRDVECSSGEMAMVRNKSGPLLLDWINLDCSKNIFHQYLSAVAAEELAPSHGAVVALDSQLTIQRAFVILLDAEPTECRVLVWDAKRQCFLAALTLTDVIGAIHHACDDFTFVSKTLAWLLEERARLIGRPTQLITATANSSLLDIITLLQDNHIHRVPIMETTALLTPVADGPVNFEESVLCWLGWKRVLRCISGQLRACHEWSVLKRPLRESRVGTWTSLAVVTRSTPIKEAIAVLIERRLTALPVVESISLTLAEKVDALAMDCDVTPTANTERGRLVDVVTKNVIADAVLQICNRRKPNAGASTNECPSHHSSPPLSIIDLATLTTLTVGEVLARRSHVQPLSRWVVNTSDSLTRAVDKLVATDNKVLFVTDHAGVVVASLSLSDVCKRLLDHTETPCSSPAASAMAVYKRQRGNSESFTYSRDVYTRSAMISPNWRGCDALSMSDASPLRQMQHKRPQVSPKATTVPMKHSPIRLRNPTANTTGRPPAQLNAKDHSALS